MRAVVYSESGSAEVMRVVDRPLPEPAAGEIRVRLARAGVNPTDWKARSGVSTKLAYDEVTPGQDGAGLVDAVGADVADLATGDRVWLMLAQHGRAHGTAAEYVVVPADRAFRLPDGVSFDVGASLGVPAVTAHRALTSGERVGPTPGRLGPGTLTGQVVLVHGGAGAVGNAAIQLAVWSGATVVATVSSPEKGALASAAGAHRVVNYRDSEAAAAIKEIAPEGVDLIVEVAPAVNADLDREVIGNRGTIAVYANNGGDELTLPVRATFSKNIRYQFILLYTIGDDLLATAAEDVTKAVALGALQVGDERGLPLHHFALDDAADAHQAVEDGVVGKVLIDLD